MNCAAELLDKPVTRGHGDRIALRTPDGECTYTQLFTQANRIANVLVREMGLKPGNRVLLRGPNNPMMAACWFAVMKAGGICVATMPLLRAKELTEIISKAEVTHALCDKRLEEELKAAQAACPSLKSDQVLVRRQPGLDRLAGAEAAAVVHQRRHRGRRRRADRLHLRHHRQAEGHDALPPRRDGDVRLLPALAASSAHKDDIFCGTPPLAFTFGLGGMLCFPMRFGASSVLVEKLTPETPAGDDRALQGDGVLHRADHVPRHGGRIAEATTTSICSLKKCVSAGRGAARRHAPAVQARRPASRSSTASARPR